MAAIEITTVITHRSLMSKTKNELADMVLQYADFNDRLHRENLSLRQFAESVPDGVEPNYADGSQHGYNCRHCKAWAAYLPMVHGTDCTYVRAQKALAGEEPNGRPDDP